MRVAIIGSHNSFSILYRIEWVVTCFPWWSLPLCLLAFQYPVSDRMGCNQARAVRVATALRPFSILYRIEWVVTLRQVRGAGAEVPAFSILYRIEWVVTGLVALLGPRDHAFQYPVSDRMGCNI